MPGSTFFQLWRGGALLALATSLIAAAARVEDLAPGATAAFTWPANVKNNNPAEAMAPQAVLDSMILPSGFKATVFAADPVIGQPISLSFDDRGRLWVAECYSYKTSAGPWKSDMRDRISVFTDSNGDGVADKRTIFSDTLTNLTSVLPGFGGVYACTTPNLVFIPDRNGDDVPDSEPEILLDGWNDGKIGHCVMNGLTWGPDGWLYGCHGIQGESLIGKPGTPPEQRTRFNGGIWRYHPKTARFEVVCEGTTNPWGLDWNDYGDAFFTNCVIGHLWQLIPGAHYKRMYGADYTKNTYDLIDTIADHRHWGSGGWQDSRKQTDETSKAGGGHAHCGCMVYLGDNWPDSYRNQLFVNNILGRRLNEDTLEHVGTGWVGHHGPDLLIANAAWYRPVVVTYGPDGAVYIADWADIGECHGNDGAHRTSGRIYKIAYGQPKPQLHPDLAALDDAALVGLQLQHNDWYVRHARRLLEERAIAGRDLAGAKAGLLKLLADNPDVTRKLRALWALQVVGGLDEATLLPLLKSSEEYLRVWAIRLLCEEKQPSAAATTVFAELAASDPSPTVRLYLASALQRMPLAQRWDIVAGLIRHGEDAGDHNQPLMLWYGMEPLVTADAARMGKLLGETKIPRIVEFVARRMAGK